MRVTDGGLFVGDDLFQEFSALGSEIGRELERAIVLDHCLLDPFDRQAREVAQPLFAPAAGEVRVLVAGAICRLVEDKPRRVPRPAAADARQRALEIVVVNAVAISIGAAVPKNILNAFVELVADQRLMASRVDLAFPRDVSDVVRIAQHVVEGGRRYRPRNRVPACRRGSQPEIGHRRLQFVDPVIAGRVEFPRLHDQGPALLVDLDGVHLTAFEWDSGIDVTDFRAPTGTAVHHLVQHFGADVLAGKFVLGVVEDVGDGGHHVRVDPGTKVLFRRDQCHAYEVELAFGDGGVDVVAEST
nr:hypothetical protein [Nocardia sp. SYP-A9097]